MMTTQRLSQKQVDALLALAQKPEHQKRMRVPVYNNRGRLVAYVTKRFCIRQGVWVNDDNSWEVI